MTGFFGLGKCPQGKGMPIPQKPHWKIIVVDQEILIKFSNFFKHKDEMMEHTCGQLYQWEQNKLGITHL